MFSCCFVWVCSILVGNGHHPECLLWQRVRLWLVLILSEFISFLIQKVRVNTRDYVILQHTGPPEWLCLPRLVLPVRPLDPSLSLSLPLVSLASNLSRFLSLVSLASSSRARCL